MAMEAQSRRALQRSPVLGRLPPDLLLLLAAEAHERPMARGEVLFRRGDAGGSMMAVLRGEVHVTIGSPDGRQHLLRRLGPGEVFGEIALLDGRPRTADATAGVPGRLLVLERAGLQACLAREPAMAMGLVEVLCDRLRSTSVQLETQLFQDAAVRLAGTLLALAAGRPGGSVDVTQEVLGSMIGATRESVNKRLRLWQRQGWVALRPGRVTLRDAAALATLLPEPG